MGKEIIGRMVCAVCGESDGMRVTHDKNGEPFAFCDATCGAQLRIGGNPDRVRRFYAAHPAMKPAAPPAPPPAAKPAAVSQPETPPPPAAKPVPTPPPRKRGFLDDVMDMAK